MGRPFSERVATEEWRHEAEDWIRAELACGGVTVTGEIQQPRIRPWSTQLTIPTDAGTMWFKANCRALAFEPLLQVGLARISLGAVDTPVALDGHRGWMMTADRGATMDDEAPTADWRQVLGEAARLQRLAAGHRDELLATGMPDCGPTTVVERYDRLIDVFSGLPEEHPAHIDYGLRSQLLAVRERIAEAASALAASSLPTAWQHGDLHPRNVFRTGSTLRVFDFGDSQWAHAAEILNVPFALVTGRTSVPWPEVLEAYREVWQVNADDLAAQWRATGLTHPVNRTLLWWSCLQEASAEEWRTWGAAPLDHLRRVLDA